MQFGTLPRGLTLYRGKATIRPLQPVGQGESYSDVAFLPTSISETIARTFIKYGITKYQFAPQKLTLVLTEYRIMGNNVKGLFMPAVFKAAGEVDALAAKESEVLLNRNLHFRGLGYRTAQFEGKTLYIETIGVYQ